MRAETTALLVAGIILGTILGSPSPAAAQPSARVDILFDLGDGVYLWSEVTVPDPLAPNASWDATLSAAARYGLGIKSAWFDCCGVAVFDVGDRNPPAGFVGLYLWNRTAEIWEASPTGISGLVLRDGDAIAWYNAGFDSVTFETRFPVPSPVYRTPTLMFRGDTANGGSTAAEAPNHATVLWDRDLGIREIVSTPAVAYGRLFFSTFDGRFALDANTGGIVWSNPSVTGFSSPAVFDGTVLAGSADGRLYRLNATDGSERWNVTLLDETRFSGITSSPKVAFDWVYVGTFNESGGPGEVVALWASNGTVAWRHSTGSIHFSSPAIMNGTLYVGVMGLYNTSTEITFDPPYGVLALNAADGSERWFFRTEGPVAASPVVSGPRVVVPSKDGFLYAIERDTGAEVWRANLGPSTASPAIHEGTIYAATGSFGGSSVVSALDAATGSVRWTFVPNGPVQASLTYADGKVFASTNAPRGTIYALDAASGEAVWTYEPSPPEFILASPVVSDGTLFASSDNGHVYAFRDARSSETPSPWPWIGLAVGIVAVAGAAIVLYRRRGHRRVSP